MRIFKIVADESCIWISIVKTVDKIVLECAGYREWHRQVNLSKQRARHSKVSINDVKKLAISWVCCLEERRRGPVFICISNVALLYNINEVSPYGGKEKSPWDPKLLRMFGIPDTYLYLSLPHSASEVWFECLGRTTKNENCNFNWNLTSRFCLLQRWYHDTESQRCQHFNNKFPYIVVNTGN